jgi:hypothetical protein
MVATFSSDDSNGGNVYFPLHFPNQRNIFKPTTGLPNDAASRYLQKHEIRVPSIFDEMPTCVNKRRTQAVNPFPV